MGVKWLTEFKPNNLLVSKDMNASFAAEGYIFGGMVSRLKLTCLFLRVVYKFSYLLTYLLCAIYRLDSSK